MHDQHSKTYLKVDQPFLKLCVKWQVPISSQKNKDRCLVGSHRRSDDVIDLTSFFEKSHLSLSFGAMTDFFRKFAEMFLPTISNYYGVGQLPHINGPR